MHSSGKVRRSAIFDLGQHGSGHQAETVIAALQRALIEDPLAEVRHAAATSLATVLSSGDPEAEHCAARCALPALVMATRDRAPPVRSAAALALGELGTAAEASAIAALRELAGDAVPGVRFQALEALVRLGIDLDEHLASALADTDTEIRLLGLRLLLESRGEPAVEVVDQPPGEGMAPSSAVSGRARFGGAWSVRVSPLLDDRDPRVRLLGAAFLSDRGDRSAEAMLVELWNDRRVALEEEDEQVAIELIVDRGLFGALPGLRRRVSRSGFSTATGLSALAALARLGDSKARSRIVQSLRSWSWDRRTLAAYLVGKALIIEAEPRLHAMRNRPALADPVLVEDALRLLSQVVR